jgi:pimeloyl-ACP methyl ester carboxylesterase
MSMLRCLVFIVLIVLIAGVALAQEALEGEWRGQIGPGSLNLGVVVTFALDEGVLTGRIDIPAQGLPLEILEASDDAARFVIIGVPGNATFEGEVVGEVMAGSFTQAGQSIPFRLERPTAAAVSGVAVVDALLGDWQGVIDPQGVRQRVFLRFSEADSAMIGAISFPDQALTLPLLIEEADETGLVVVIEGVPGNQTFRGALVEGRLEGTFAVGAQRYEAVFERSDEGFEVRRPQEPKPPFPYRTEEVTVESNGVRLAGTLTLPEGEGPFAAVVMLTGSGPQDRDGTLFGHKPFLLLADTLTRAGFATLRMDDRGVGASGGAFEETGYAEFAADVLAKVAYLQTRPEIDPQRIGLLGHSEGGYIAPLAIAQGAEAAFFISLAGPAVDGLRVLKLQNALIYRQLGADDETIARQQAYLRALRDLLAAERLDEARALTREHLRWQFEALGYELEEDELELALAQQEATLAMPWFRDFITFDPQPYLRELTVPTLAIYGKLDVQVPAVQNMGVMQGTLQRAGNRDVTVVAFDDLNHLLQPAVTGAIEEYAQIEVTMAPEVLVLIESWLRERFLD